MAGSDADPATGAAGRGAGGTRWCDDQGGGPIPPDHVGMRAYLGPVPEVATDAPGYGDGGPQAFMVEMGAATAPLRTHFHVVDQFQVVVHGGGTLGRHRLGPGAVHYADALHPYGPLAAGPDGLAYLTLRATSDTGAWFTPDRRDDLAARRAGEPAGCAAAQPVVRRRCCHRRLGRVRPGGRVPTASASRRWRSASVRR